ncbi:MAG: T9SS type A sorting domain-containing protein [Bacteroidetes bacterium]|nr:T9SS type A sorting domain-containing protein [Bacteroidota bacterium]
MKKSFCFLILCLFPGTFSFAQKEASKPMVSKPVYYDVSPPLRDMVKMPMKPADNSWKSGNIKNRLNPRKQRVLPNLPGNFTDPAGQYSQGPVITSDTTIQNFDGNNNTQGYDPPDTHGDVGPNHFFQVVNCHYSIYNKTGTLLLGPSNTSTIWSGMPYNSNNGDGVVLYDDNANRWLVVQLSLPNGMTAPFYEMVAVSQTADPTGSWYRYEYSFTDLPDYEKLGVWADGYYMSCNRFTSSSLNYAGTGQGVFNRSKMLIGDPTAEMVYFTLPASDNAWALLPSDCDGAFPTAGTPNYFVYFWDGPYYLGIYEFHVDWTNTANSTFGNYLQLTINSFNDNITGIPQKGSTKLADVLADRLMYRVQFRKFSDHWGMVCNHTVNANGAGVGGIRWYELRKSTGAWWVRQQSTFQPDINSRWMGSIALDTAGNIALGYSISSSNMYPAIRYTGRMKNDILNTMTIAEKGIYNGSGSNTAGDGVGGSGNCRWGDYSAMLVDPSAYALFWYTQQYVQTSGGAAWRTRIASFSFANVLSLTASANPSTITVPQTSQLNVIALGGTGSYTYSWTSIPAGFTSNIQNPVVSPTLTIKYIAHVTSGTQTKTDTTQVTVNMSVTASATPPSITIGQTSQLNSNAYGGSGAYTYLWTSIPPGYTSNIQNPVVSPTITTQYIVTANDGTQSKADTALVTVTYLPLTVIASANPSLVCAGQTVQLTATPAGGTLVYNYSWSSIPIGFTSYLQNPIVQPTITTQYVVAVSDGNSTTTDTTLVTVVPYPTSFAGNDTTYCIYITAINLQGTATNYSSVVWTTSGTGTFSNIFALITDYFPSNADKTSGNINLNLLVYPQSPCVNTVSNTEHVLFDPCIGIPETGNQTFSVTIEPNPTTGYFTLNITGLNNRETSVSIFDSQGKQVFAEKIFHVKKIYQQNLDFSHFGKGIYLVRVEKGEKVRNLKLIVE